MKLPGSALLPALLLGALPAAAQETAPAPPITLVAESPDSARRAIEGLLAGGRLGPAEALAREFARTWNDSVPYRTVAWFRSSAPAERAAKVAVDSLRRAGGSALRAEGLSPALRLWRASLREAGRIGDSVGIVAATVNLGVGFYTDGQPDSARPYLASGYRLALLGRDYRAAGTAVGTLASVAKDRGDLREASDLYREAATLHDRVGDSRGLAAAHNNLGLVAAATGDTAGARRSYERALELNRRYDRPAAAAANLVNLGTLADLEGAYGRAARLYADALAAYTAAGDRRNVALALHNLGRLELRRGNYRRAVTRLEEALATVEPIGPPGDVVSVRIDLSRALAAAGDVAGGASVLDRAERGVPDEALGDRDRATLALARAEVEARLNRPAATDRYLTRAERHFRSLGDPGGLADVQEQRALYHIHRGEHRRARARLAAALESRALAGDARAGAGTRLLLGYVDGTLDDTASARREYIAARAVFAEVGDAVGEAVALGALGGLELEQGLALSADSLYAAALARLARRPAPPVAWWLHLGRGEALRARNRPEAAAAELRSAVAMVERSSGGFALPATRAAFMADKWRPYATLARLHQSLGRADSAFETSERMRAQEMLERLTLGAGSAEGDSMSRPTLRDLRLRITELSARLGDAEPAGAEYRGPQPAVKDEAAVWEALAEAEDAYARTLEGVQRAGGAGRAGFGRATVPTVEVRRRLRPDEALLEYLIADSVGMVFVVTADSVAAFELQVGSQALFRLVDFARSAIAPASDSVAPALWRAPLQRLYGYLVAPVEHSGLLRGKRRLVIVPHATLHYLPFAALMTPGAPDGFLAERYAISYAPSASVWARLSEGASPARARLLMLAPMARRVLPGAEAEVRQIAGGYGDGALSLLGTDATEGRFQALASGFDVLHLASFGVLNKQNPLFSYVALQPDSSADGRLEVHEIFGLSLRASLVVLSACQTALGAGALGDVPPGDDWVGLVQAFLHAGSAQVLATLWPVADRPTASLMNHFYAGLRQGTPDDLALAEAQRALLRDRTTRHPRYWAGFVLTGKEELR